MAQPTGPGKRFGEADPVPGRCCDGEALDLDVDGVCIAGSGDYSWRICELGPKYPPADNTRHGMQKKVNKVGQEKQSVSGIEECRRASMS